MTKEDTEKPFFRCEIRENLLIGGKIEDKNTSLLEHRTLAGLRADLNSRIDSLRHAKQINYVEAKFYLVRPAQSEQKEIGVVTLYPDFLKYSDIWAEVI